MSFPRTPGSCRGGRGWSGWRGRWTRSWRTSHWRGPRPAPTAGRTHPVSGHFWLGLNRGRVNISAWKSFIRRFVITDKVPTRAFSWLKAATTAFTFKTLLRHYAKRALTPRSVDLKLGPRRKYHKERAAIRHYTNQPARPLWLLRHVYWPWGQRPFSIVS